jgi:hypothetical protein
MGRRPCISRGCARGQATAGRLGARAGSRVDCTVLKQAHCIRFARDRRRQAAGLSSRFMLLLLGYSIRKTDPTTQKCWECTGFNWLDTP